MNIHKALVGTNKSNPLCHPFLAYVEKSCSTEAAGHISSPGDHAMDVEEHGELYEDETRLGLDSLISKQENRDLAAVPLSLEDALLSVLQVYSHSVPAYRIYRIKKKVGHSITIF